VLADDSAVLVVAPFFTPDTKATPRNPVYLHYSDAFQRPIRSSLMWSSR